MSFDISLYSTIEFTFTVSNLTSAVVESLVSVDCINHTGISAGVSQPAEVDYCLQISLFLTISRVGGRLSMF